MSTANQLSIETLFDQVKTHVHESTLLGSIQGLLEWDERTKLPLKSGDFRAEQVTYLAGKIHQRVTDPQLADWLVELDSMTADLDSHSLVRATVTELRREFEKQSKLPQKLVEEMTKLTIVGQQKWGEARGQNNYAMFAPTLSRMIELKKEQAAILGGTNRPYDVWLDDFEPFESTDNVSRVLDDLKKDLVPLVDRIKGSDQNADVSILSRFYSRDLQAEFATQAAKAIGFDFDRGRIDETTHPFCTGIAPNDCRITTRYDERFFNSAFFGTLHEAGHGIYDQGVPSEYFGIAPGMFCSLGIHESQSRMWENQVGRSLSFWEYFFPIAKSTFPDTLSDVDLRSFYRAVNHVQPSFIRVEADEATYDLHIIIRFEIEQLIANSEIEVDSIPDAWNEKYLEYLGISPDNYAEGVLQDVHWAAGLFGYFPTYTLGNLYASQFYGQATSDLGDLESQFKNGNFTQLKEWLNENIHSRGRCYRAKQLVELVTGKSLSHKPRIEYLTSKYSELYQL